MNEATENVKAWVMANLDIEQVYGIARRAAAIDGKCKSPEPRLEPTPSRIQRELARELCECVPVMSNANRSAVDWVQLSLEIIREVRNRQCA